MWKVVVTDCWPAKFKVSWGGSGSNDPSNFFRDRMAAEEEAKRRNREDERYLEELRKSKDK